MKRSGAAAIAMAPFLSVVAVLLGTASAATVHNDGTTSQSSVSQIRDTLRNLLRSIEDNGRDAEALFGKRQQWCDSKLSSFDAANDAASASLEDMKARLTEAEAEVEEAEGTVQQVKVDIEMVQHTIKQTQDMLQDRADQKADTHLLSALSENKELSLASLQGELEVAVPVLAQLQANVAETKQRISYRTDSLAASQDFVDALKASCQASADRSDTQATARVGESNSLHVALQALDASSAIQPAADSTSTSDDSASQALSFVQVGDRSQEVTTDDLSDLFSADQEAHPEDKEEVVKSEVEEKPKAADDTAVAVAPSLRPRIQTLLAQLQAEDSNGLDQSTWCAKQRESSAMALKFAQDAVAQISSELDAHSDSETELGDEADKLKDLTSKVSAAAKAVFVQATKERALVQSSRKDQQLATKILDQAMTIMKDLGMADSKKIVGALTSAKKMLLAQIKASSGFEKDAKDKASVVGEKALATSKAQESEQHNLEFAKDDHAQQRLSGVENKRLYESDVQEATSYVQKLEESCKADAEDEAKQQRSVQVRALEDANKALDGKLLEAKSGANSLRGVDKPKTIPQNLSPMERAAMEMGVSTD